MELTSLRCFLAVMIASVILAPVADAQFTSGSTGADGALAFPNAKPGDVILFDPSTFNPPLDPEHDNIYNFTTINIPAGVTVKLSGKILTGPVVWLATLAVDIEGTLDLSGNGGHPRTTISSLRLPATPGPGGYPGGVGGNTSGSLPAEPGLGPAGGAAATNSGGCTAFGQGGGFTGNSFLVPLFGGSGGGGELFTAPPEVGGGGGAGGGAILIASSASITLNGAIYARGGIGDNSGLGGGGSGGAIRLMAPVLQGTGLLTVENGGNNNANTEGCGGPAGGAKGVIRLEAGQQLFNGSIVGSVTSGTPFNTFVTQPSTTPKITVVSVNGVAVNPNPTGSFQMPDVTINSAAPVPIAIQASNVPLGTIVNLQIYSENGPDIITTTGPLTGASAALSTATATVTLPTGFSRGFVIASFTSSAAPTSSVRTTK